MRISSTDHGTSKLHPRVRSGSLSTSIQGHRPTARARYKKLRRKALDAGLGALENLRDIDGRLELDPGRSGTSLCSDLVQNIKAQVVNVVLFGKYTSGKSTLLGSLLDRPSLLPRSTGPTTAVVTRVQYGEWPSATLHFAGRRVFGPMQEWSASEQARAIEAVLGLWHSRENPVSHAVVIEHPSGARSQINKGDLSRYLFDLKRIGLGSPAPKSWGELRLTLKKRDPLRIHLKGAKKKIFHKWLSSDHLPLWLDRVDVRLPDDRLRGVVVTDTPGIDSLQVAHRDATSTTVKSGQAIVFLMDTRNLDLHPDDRRAYQQLFEWLGGVPEKLFHVCSFSDLALENLLDDEPELDEFEAIEEMRRCLNRGLSETLTEFEARRQGGIPSHLFAKLKKVARESSLFLVNAAETSDCRFDGARLWSDVREYLDRAEGIPALRYACQQLHLELKNREALLRSNLQSEGRDEVKQFEAARSKVHAAEDLLGKLDSRLESLHQENAREVSSTTEAVKGWVRNSFVDKGAANEVFDKWQPRQREVVLHLDRRTKSFLSRLEDEINELLDANDEVRFTLPNLDVSKTKIDIAAIREPLERVTYYLKGILDFFGFDTRSSNVREARNETLRELDRLNSKIVDLDRQRLNSIRTQVRPALQRVSDSLKAFERKLRTFESNRRDLEAWNVYLRETADKIALHHKELEKIAMQA